MTKNEMNGKTCFCPFCCCNDKAKHWEKEGEKFGQDCLNRLRFWVVGCTGKPKVRPFSYFDKSPEAREFWKRHTAFLKAIGWNK